MREDHPPNRAGNLYLLHRAVCLSPVNFVSIARPATLVTLDIGKFGVAGSFAEAHGEHHF